MNLTSPDSAVIQKTRELCQAILDQPELGDVLKKIGAFKANKAAQKQYELLREKGGELHQKQHEGHSLTKAEIADFEERKQKFFKEAANRDFLDAQQVLQQVQDSVNQYVSLTFELGRLPTSKDFDEEGSCGHGCGCH